MDADLNMSTTHVDKCKVIDRVNRYRPDITERRSDNSKTI